MDDEKIEAKEKIRKEIEYLLDQIELEKSFNENSGNLSFLYYQLAMENKKLEEMEK